MSWAQCWQSIFLSFPNKKMTFSFCNVRMKKCPTFLCVQLPSLPHSRVLVWKQDKKMMWKSGFLHFLPRFFPIKEFFTSDITVLSQFLKSKLCRFQNGVTFMKKNDEIHVYIFLTWLSKMQKLISAHLNSIFPLHNCILVC